jgi:hypothetical protein
MNTDYENAVGDAGGALITHIGLVDDTGSEISGGSYSRLAVTWTSAGSGGDADGTIRPTADLTFDVPAGVTVAEWRGYSASSGGTDYGGASFTNETFSNAGSFTLEAANTAINHDAQ